MVLCTDGFDQAKTCLPCLKDYSHVIDGLKPAGGIGVHAVSTVCFGGPEPLLGFLNFADINKNSSLTVTNLHRAITRQLEALLKKDQARVDDFLKANPLLSGADEAQVKLASWPRRLHVCFDNAVGENLNTNVMMYLGALVHHGVFHRITIGTLLVGHTHNINDQLFSVWSKFLDHNDVKTPSQMVKAFEENYHSNMKETDAARLARETLNSSAQQSVVDLTQALPDAPMKAPGDALNDSKSCMSSSEVCSLYVEEKGEKTKRLYFNAMKDLRDASSIHRPIIEVVNKNAHVAGWLGDDILKTAKRSLQNVGRYHNFSIDKDPSSGDTFLHRKFTVDAHIIYDKPHPFILEDGPYRHRDLLYRSGVTIDRDPVAYPFQTVETEGTKKLLEALTMEHSINDVERAELHLLVQKFQVQVAAQAANCITCGTLTSRSAAVGVIRQLKGVPTANEKEAHKDKTKERETVHGLLATHLGDHAEATLRAHNAMRMPGWWTKYLFTYIPLIQAHYVSRNITQKDANAGAAAMRGGFLAHPEDLDNAEQIAYLRVERICYSEIGAPKPDHFVILRAKREEYKSYFWLGKVRQYRDVTQRDMELEEATMQLADQRLTNDSLDPYSADALRGLPSHETLCLDEGETPQAGVKRRGGKDALAPASASENIFKHTHVFVDWYDYVKSSSVPTPYAQDLAASRKRAQPEAGKQSKQRGSKKHRSGTPPLSKVSASASAADAVRRSGRKKVALKESLNDVDSQGENGSESSGSEYSLHQRDDGDTGDDENAMEDSPERGLEGEPAAAAAAGPPLRSGSAEFRPLKEAQIRLWSKLQFVPLSQDQNLSNKRWMPVSSLLWWGPQSEILTKNLKIKAGVFSRIVQDLTQVPGI